MLENCYYFAEVIKIRKSGLIINPVNYIHNEDFAAAGSASFLKFKRARKKALQYENLSFSNSCQVLRFLA